MKVYNLVLGLLVSTSAARGQNIHLKILDGKTGNLVKGLKVRTNLWTGNGPICKGLAVTGAQSYYVDANGAEMLQIGLISAGNADAYDYNVCEDADCKHGTHFGGERIAELVSTGIVRGSSRKAAQFSAEPGVLTVFVRKITWLNRLESRLYS